MPPPERPRVLLTVSGTIPDDLEADVASGRRPRPDYAVIREACGAELIDMPTAVSAQGRLGRFVGKYAPEFALAWYCFRARRRYDVIITDGEQVGLLLALLSRMDGRRRVRHLMIVHVMSTPVKRALMRVGFLSTVIDHYLVYCSHQRNLLNTSFGVPLDRITQSPFMVDTAFFRRDLTDVEPGRTVSSAGLERRDYTTLIQAVRGLDVDVVIAAASPWSRRRDSTKGQQLPPNVRVCSLDLHELRDLYAQSSIVVLPLLDVDFQAGITTILEAFSMGLPVVVTRTRGQTDVVVEGVTGHYVAPGDAAELRRTIERLLDAPDRAASLGENARAWAVRHADVEEYADVICGIVQQLSSVDGETPSPTPT